MDHTEEVFAVIFPSGNEPAEIVHPGNEALDLPRSFVPAARLSPILKSEQGSSLIELAIVMPVLTLLLLGVADLSRAYYLGIVVSRAAQSAVRYATQNPSDSAGTVSAATADASDIPSFTASSVNVTWGCECSDGSGASVSCITVPSCSGDIVSYFQVDTTSTYQTLFPYPLIPKSIVLHGSARLRAFR
jgi:Flp pilus assembly protein TadG